MRIYTCGAAEERKASIHISNIQSDTRGMLSSKWFMKSIGHEGLNNLLVAYEDKSAQAVATFGFSKGPGHETILFQGKTDVRR